MLLLAIYYVLGKVFVFEESGKVVSEIESKLYGFKPIIVILGQIKNL